MTKQIKFQVIDKFAKNGFFGRKYFIVLKVEEGQFEWVGKHIHELRVNAESYYAYSVGSFVQLPMQQSNKEDDRWFFDLYG